MDPVKHPLTLTKEEAAVRQAEAAIDAFEAGAYDVAITLAGAAEGMLADRESGLFLHSMKKSCPTAEPQHSAFRKKTGMLFSTGSAIG